jgi:SAM-dependent methyltransferase
MSGTALLEAHKTDWEELAALDPMWAILSEKEKRGNKWSAPDFFATGKDEIDGLMEEISTLSHHRTRALDFGCGLGRLTRSLLDYYDEAHGIDVSETMIRRARQFTPECHFHVNDSPDLWEFSDSTFDLVYTNRVLQHMPSPKVIAEYLREFFRITKPGGLVVFQVPHRKSIRNAFNLKRSAYHLLKTLGLHSEVLFSRLRLHPMRMTAIPRTHVLEIIEASSGELIKQRPDSSAHFAVFYYCRRLH